MSRQESPFPHDKVLIALSAADRHSCSHLSLQENTLRSSILVVAGESTGVIRASIWTVCDATRSSCASRAACSPSKAPLSSMRSIRDKCAALNSVAVVLNHKWLVDQSHILVPLNGYRDELKGFGNTSPLAKIGHRH